MNNRGFVLILSFMVIVLLGILTTALISRSVTERVATQRLTESQQAFWLAEAGINRAINELKDNVDWPGTEGVAISLGSGQYRIAVTAPSADLRVVTSTGFIPNSINTRSTRTVEVDIDITSQATPNYAFFAKDSIDVTLGSITGDVATNSESAGAIDFTGGILNGNAYCGPNGDPDTVIQGIASSKKKNLTSSIDLDSLFPKTPPPGTQDLGNLSGLKIELDPGTWLCTGISLTSVFFIPAKLTTKGPVTLYVNGDINLTAVLSAGITIEGKDGIPENLTIIMVGNHNINLTGVLSLPINIRAGLYAPDSDLAFNLAPFKINGLVVARNIDLTLALGSTQIISEPTSIGMGGGQTEVSISRWEDLNKPY